MLQVSRRLKSIQGTRINGLGYEYESGALPKVGPSEPRILLDCLERTVPHLKSHGRKSAPNEYLSSSCLPLQSSNHTRKEKREKEITENLLSTNKNGKMSRSVPSLLQFSSVRFNSSLVKGSSDESYLPIAEITGNRCCN